MVTTMKCLNCDNEFHRKPTSTRSYCSEFLRKLRNPGFIPPAQQVPHAKLWKHGDGKRTVWHCGG